VECIFALPPLEKPQPPPAIFPAFFSHAISSLCPVAHGSKHLLATSLSQRRDKGPPWRHPSPSAPAPLGLPSSVRARAGEPARPLPWIRPSLSPWRTLLCLGPDGPCVRSPLHCSSLLRALHSSTDAPMLAPRPQQAAARPKISSFIRGVGSPAPCVPSPFPLVAAFAACAGLPAGAPHMAGPLPPMLSTPPQNSSRSSSSPYRRPCFQENTLPCFPLPQHAKAPCCSLRASSLRGALAAASLANSPSASASWPPPWSWSATGSRALHVRCVAQRAPFLAVRRGARRLFVKMCSKPRAAAAPDPLRIRVLHRICVAPTSTPFTPVRRR
jgi:hypothetical protein